MASDIEWDAEKMLEIYLHDYMLKRNMHKTAEIFRKEANVRNTPVVLDSPEGFLYEWWSIFYDVYASRRPKQLDPKEDASVQASQIIENELQNACAQMPLLRTNHQNLVKFPFGVDLEMMMAHPESCLFPEKVYGEEHLGRPARGFDPNLQQLDVSKMDLSKSVATSSSPLQQICSNQSQQKEYGEGILLGRSTTRGPTLYGVPKGILQRSGPLDAGLNEGVSSMPLEGWPLNGVDRIPRGLGRQVVNSLLPVSHHMQQFETSIPHHQMESFTHLLSSGPRKPMSCLLGTSGHSSTCNMMLPEDILMNPSMKFKLKQAVEHQQQDDRLQQQLHEKDKKRKTSSYVQPDGNTSACKDVEAKNIDENVESFFSDDDDQADMTSTVFSRLKRRSSTWNKDEYRGFTFEEVCCLHSSKSKVLCCHFSSEGRLLATAGHDRRVLIWNMETYNFFNTSEGHSHLISDVRFRPNSTIFATSSFDQMVQIWDAAKPTKPLFKLPGHAEQVTSLDFHPRKVDLLCSCDCNDEIRLWNVNQCACTRISKGATRQVRFQPRSGKLLATAAGNGINVIDVETDSLQSRLERHVKEVRSICWDTSGKYMASVSEDSARVWSVTSGKCIHELHSNGSNFQSCTFHPGYSQLLVIGGYQSLELWNPTASSRTMTVPAHNGIISALADSPQTEIISSASHDQCVKLWK